MEPKPYYKDDLVTLYLGDCLETRAWLEADVLVTDPPYGTQPDSTTIGYGRKVNPETGFRGQMIANDSTTDTRDAVLAAWGDRPALVFGSPRLPDPPIAVADRLVWDKRRLGMNGGPWRYRHESIYVTAGFLRSSDASGSVLSAFPEQEHHIHGKPLALMSALVETAPPGVIADPFAGSGTTLVAAAQLGRKAIGVELDERYCRLIVKRLQQQAFVFDVRSSGWSGAEQMFDLDELPA